ncbi:retropepsin-like aspartic protease [Stratiformator vulcanicus]|uniref:Aspartyl protease n=1 Tax=Stratiformator vulcanicus TaxID=2527980 RepID=A0A517R0K2_9PLAN|nr:retropepsin-like aspartic protease [Stratiformator vulcanicus]QDT37363.1 hypothetical protein Pan189_17360 [Stratiformator vulcanicus]
MFETEKFELPVRVNEIGRVVVPAIFENLDDLLSVRHGTMDEQDIRRMKISEALVDTGASRISVPIEFIERLGLKRHKEVSLRTANGWRKTGMYELVKVSVFDRETFSEVIELPSGSPVLIGQLPLQSMDWVIDMKNECLRGNPEHGGEWMDEVW